MPRKAHLIFDLDGLEVFYFYSEFNPDVVDINKIYWRDDVRFPQLYFGPYASIYAATKEYSIKTKEFEAKQPSSEPKAKFIQVDFQKRIRLDPEKPR